MSDDNLEEPIGPEAELKLLAIEKALLESELAELQKPECLLTSVSLGEMVAEMKKHQDEDGFLVTPAGPGEAQKNPFHASAPSAGSGGGGTCCVVQ
jgi:hypothetical protein